MQNCNPSLAEVIRGALEHRLGGVRVAMPARIENYDATEQTVDVQPLIKRIVGSGSARQARSLPVVPRVPVAFPRGGGFFVSFPIQVGDTVLLIVADRSIDTWFTRGGEVEPLDQRTHNVADAIAIPGIADSTAPIGDVDTADMVLGRDGGSHVRVTSDGEVRLGRRATEPVALASKVESELGNLIDWCKTHTHPAPGGATSASAQAANLQTPQSVAATKVKAE